MVTLEDCRVPAANMLGEEGKVQATDPLFPHTLEGKTRPLYHGVSVVCCVLCWLSAAGVPHCYEGPEWWKDQYR